MYWTIAKKEFLSNLLNFRFVAGFILCFLLATLNAWIVTADYAERVANYSDAAQKHKEELENANTIRSGLLDIVLLVLFNFAFFIGAYVAFLRYDVR